MGLYKDCLTWQAIALVKKSFLHQGIMSDGLCSGEVFSKNKMASKVKWEQSYGCSHFAVMVLLPPQKQGRQMLCICL